MGDVNIDSAATLRRVRARLVAMKDVRAALVREKDRLLVHSHMQVVFNSKMSSEFDRSVHETIMTHALHAEKLGPGGFDRTVDLVLEKLGALEVPPRPTQLEPRSATAADVRSLVNAHASRAGVRTTKMLERALELAGYGGRIIIEKTHSLTPSVELVRGYTFDLVPILPIDASFVHPRVVCIDGYVEEVSEIHHLLEAAATAKEPVVVFLRGMSNDVKHTLKVNYDRGSLRMLPISAPFDLDGMNSLVDLSVVCGADLVSSLKGDLISSIKFHDAPYVEQVTVFKGRTIVANTSTHAQVAVHVANLRKRREDEQVDDKGKLLDKRIKSLSPNHVIIRLPDDRDYVVCSQAIDNALRAIKSAVDFGVTETGELVATEMSARVHADRCIKTLSQLGAYLS